MLHYKVHMMYTTTRITKYLTALILAVIATVIGFVTVTVLKNAPNSPLASSKAKTIAADQCITSATQDKEDAVYFVGCGGFF